MFGMERTFDRHERRNERQEAIIADLLEKQHSLNEQLQEMCELATAENREIEKLKYTLQLREDKIIQLEKEYAELKDKNQGTLELLHWYQTAQSTYAQAFPWRGWNWGSEVLTERMISLEQRVGALEEASK